MAERRNKTESDQQGRSASGAVAVAGAQPAKIGRYCVIAADALLGEGVVIGSHVVIHPGTVIAAGVRIGDHAVIGRPPLPAVTSTVIRQADLPPAQIGEQAIIGSGAVIYRGARVGACAMVADRALLREGSVLGDYSLLGSGAAVENGVTIGRYVKIQTGAYITAHSILEDYVFVAPMVTTTNDNFMGRTEKRKALIKGPHIRRGARVGGGSVLLPGVVVGEESVIAAGSVVTRDTRSRCVYMGSPARLLRPVAPEELLEAGECAERSIASEDTVD